MLFSKSNHIHQQEKLQGDQSVGRRVKHKLRRIEIKQKERNSLLISLVIHLYSGYSYVYLVKEESNHRLFALKKIRCPVGDRALSDAMHEIDMYQLFQNEYIIQVLVRAQIVYLGNILWYIKNAL